MTLNETVLFLIENKLLFENSSTLKLLVNDLILTLTFGTKRVILNINGHYYISMTPFCSCTIHFVLRLLSFFRTMICIFYSWNLDSRWYYIWLKALVVSCKLANTCNSDTWKAEAWGLWVQVQPGIQWDPES
jgi:hypothetical protein